ncbi:hypothetical protein QTL86_04740 [Cellulosilyticum sp. ST5]|uniref:Uncharacterized protein n=1 Tax=Cellulosilyticum lentocellum (strain ATCC 49066 / DSM 5427 / NCIMB 11756 / RHM5) TaxID=642492 RepID=F2JHI0_CELLD|nr:MULTISPECIES: hypothetical protein [Cellulosilyticum]ADZ84219.1 hypothetical protein Clole_2513 [Cellulosilyticum lentocellum DSM 5427]QEH69664.1 hypothetical protein EKH84_15200 [Cellulosilyticum sp. WCF-2]
MDEEQEFGKSKLGNFYLVKVFKSLGLMHIIVFTMMILCDVIVLLPAHIKWSVDMLTKLINLLSGGNEDYKAFFWAFLVATLVTLVVVWIVSKLLAFRKSKKQHTTYSLTQEQ